MILSFWWINLTLAIQGPISKWVLKPFHPCPYWFSRLFPPPRSLSWIRRITARPVRSQWNFHPWDEGNSGVEAVHTKLRESHLWVEVAWNCAYRGWVERWLLCGQRQEALFCSVRGRSGCGSRCRPVHGGVDSGQTGKTLVTKELGFVLTRTDRLPRQGIGEHRAPGFAARLAPCGARATCGRRWGGSPSGERLTGLSGH